MGSAPTPTILTHRGPYELSHQSLAEKLDVEQVYDDLDELVDDVKAWIASKNRGFFERGIDMLPEKWEAVIEVDGEYAPE